MKVGEEKVKYICDFACPNCHKTVIVKKKTKLIAPPEPAEKLENYFAEPGFQTTLTEVDK